VGDAGEGGEDQVRQDDSRIPIKDESLKRGQLKQDRAERGGNRGDRAVI
jgi:hypothetical protein